MKTIVAKSIFFSFSFFVFSGSAFAAQLTPIEVKTAEDAPYSAGDLLISGATSVSSATWTATGQDYVVVFDTNVAQEPVLTIKSQPNMWGRTGDVVSNDATESGFWMSSRAGWVDVNGLAEVEVSGATDTTHLFVIRVPVQGAGVREQSVFTFSRGGTTHNINRAVGPYPDLSIDPASEPLGLERITAAGFVTDVTMPVTGRELLLARSTVGAATMTIHSEPDFMGRTADASVTMATDEFSAFFPGTLDGWADSENTTRITSSGSGILMWVVRFD